MSAVVQIGSLQLGLAHTDYTEKVPFGSVRGAKLQKQILNVQEQFLQWINKLIDGTDILDKLILNSLRAHAAPFICVTRQRVADRDVSSAAGEETQIPELSPWVSTALH